ncbi:hypothetical protein Taro_048520 [Colocasia esculenta]|uniref:ATP-dependent Clp protease proteolytic subunit n=1 Tax=Colocasia esculenta TaxID=4460 RepID=A0A843X8C9_COLES|nr:hypothetical protein [Colocasia esculenta]
MANSLATSCAASPAASPATRALTVAGRTFPSKIQLSFSKSSSSSRKCTLRPRSWVSPRAVYADGYWGPERSSRKGIWSIRDDLQLQSSPYFPVEAQGGQGPPPMVQERFQSVISQLFQHRIIRCGGAVDDDMANIIVAQLLYLDAVDPNKVLILI